MGQRLFLRATELRRSHWESVADFQRVTGLCSGCCFDSLQRLQLGFGVALSSGSGFSFDGVEGLKVLASVYFGPIVVCNDPGDVLVREGEHLGEKVVLVKIFDVVDGSEGLKVVLGDRLNFA